MAFEGEHKIIPIKGISRAGADTVCEDGAMNEVIGLEYKNGSFKPYSPADSGLSLPSGTKAFYIHKSSDENIIIKDSSDELLWKSKSDFEGGVGKWSSFNPIISNVVSVEFVGNIMCVSTDDDMLEYMYDVSKKTYELYFNKDFYESLPRPKFRVSRFVEDFPMKGEYNSGNVMYVRDEYRFSSLQQDSNGGVSNTVVTPVFDKDNVLVAGLANKAKSLLAEHGRIFGYVVAVGAYKLKNGQYVMASSPVLLSAPNAINTNIYQNKYTLGPLPFFANYSLIDNGTVFKDAKYHSGSSQLWNSAMSPSFSDSSIGISTDQTLDYLNKPADNVTELAAYNSCIPSLFAWFNNSLGEKVSGGEIEYKCYMLGAYGNVLQFELEPIGYNGGVNSLEEFTKKYERVIDSFCIFLSPEISYYRDFTKEHVHYYKLYGIGNTAANASYRTASYSFDVRTNKEIFEDIGNIQNFYKVHEVPFHELRNCSGSYKNVDLVGKLGDNLLTQETLPISAFNYDSYIKGELKTYNSRLHHANYVKQLYRGYKGEDFSFWQYDTDIEYGKAGQYRLTDIGESDPMIVNIRVLIKDDEGESEIWHRYCYLNYALNPLITYPNRNAYRMEIYYNDGNDYCAAFDLHSSKHGGYAYHLQTSTENIGYIDICKPGYDLYRDKKAIEATANNTVLLKVSSPPTIVDLFTKRPNKNSLRVSQTGFVNIFDYSNYYRVGDGEIVSMCNMSTALSQDTFGRFPLLVFCTDGIYSMGVNTNGDGVYLDCSPFSREVCTNKNSICNIDGNILFASKKGLMIATSQGVMEYVPKMNGDIIHLPEVPVVPPATPVKGLGLEWYYKIIDVATGLVNSVCRVDFLEFISDADTYVSYISDKNKIIVYNKKFAYSFLIDIPTQVVTKINSTIMFDNNDYPEELYCDDSYKLLDFNNHSRGGNVMTLIQTRPLKLQEGQKVSYRVVLRGYFNATDPLTDASALLVLGSYDAINWQPIGLKQRYTDGYNNIGCVTDRVSCEYIMVIYSSPLTPDSHIDRIEITIKNKYNNKLR